MRDGNRRPSRHQDVQRVADEDFGFRVDARGRFVEYEHAGIEGQRPRERQQLFLPHRQGRPALGDRARVAVGKAFDEPIGVNRVRRRADARIVDAHVAETDVVGHRSRKQVHVLQHEAEQPAQIGGIEMADVDAVHRNPPPHVVEAQRQIDQRVVLPDPVAPTLTR
jgi:hypothetical protein